MNVEEGIALLTGGDWEISFALATAVRRPGRPVPAAASANSASATDSAEYAASASRLEELPGTEDEVRHARP